MQSWSFVFFTLTACNNNDETSRNRTHVYTKTESHTYHFPNCQSGPRTFASKEAYCQALEEELWNNQCERAGKEMLFKTDCTNSPPPTQMPSEDLDETFIPTQDSSETTSPNTDSSEVPWPNSDSDSDSASPSSSPLPVPSSDEINTQTFSPPMDSTTPISTADGISYSIKNSVAGNATPTLEKLDILAKFEQVPTFVSVPTDNGSIYNMMNASFKPFSPVKKLPDTLNIGKASSRKFISPSLDGCIMDGFDLPYIGEYNTQTSIFSLAATDRARTTNCHRFMKRISSEGLRMQFSNVPPLNGNGAVIKIVNLVITN